MVCMGPEYTHVHIMQQERLNAHKYKTTLYMYCEQFKVIIFYFCMYTDLYSEALLHYYIMYNIYNIKFF